MLDDMATLGLRKAEEDSFAFVCVKRAHFPFHSLLLVFIKFAAAGKKHRTPQMGKAKEICLFDVRICQTIYKFLCSIHLHDMMVSVCAMRAFTANEIGCIQNACHTERRQVSFFNPFIRKKCSQQHAQ